LKLSKAAMSLYFKLLIILNIISLISEIVYYTLATTSVMWIWNLFGIVWYITWIINILLIYFNNSRIAKSNIIGKWMNRISYFALIFIIFSLVILIFNNLVSAYLSSIPFLIYFLTIFSLIGVSFFGLLLAFFELKYIDNRGVLNFE